VLFAREQFVAMMSVLARLDPLGLLGMGTLFPSASPGEPLPLNR